MSIFRSIAVALLMAALGGCASQVTRPPEEPSKEPIRALASFDIEISQKCKATMSEAETQKFDVATLKGVIQRALDAEHLVAPDGDFKLKLVIDELRVRGTFNAIFWGFMAGTDQLNGTAAITRLDERPVGSFKIGTSYGLGGFAAGQDSARMSWLYEEFSKVLTKELVALRDRKPVP